MKNTIIKLCSIALLSTVLNAGGDAKKVIEVEPYTPIETVLTTLKKNNFYLGMGLSVDNISTSIYDAEMVSSFTLRAGYDFLDYLGVEARGSYGMTTGDNLEHTYSYGLYVKPQYEIAENWNLFGLLGYAQTQVTLDEAKARATQVNAETTQNGFSFGLGVEYQLNNTWSVFADAMRLIDESTVKTEGEYAIKADSLTFGGLFRF